MASLPPSSCSGFFYTVQSGDTLFTIGQRFGVSVNQLIAANPQISDPNRIFPGQQICIPRDGNGKPPKCKGFLYTVQPGDSLFTIGQRFGVSVNQLIAANPQLPDPNRIFPGQQICIPADGNGKPPKCKGFLYTVQSGDTLFNIGRRFGVSVDALIAANPQISDPNRIFPGQQICIPADGNGKPPKCSGFLYTVQSGDTLFFIGRRFGVSVDALIKANPQISDPNRIFPGQQICIPAN